MSASEAIAREVTSWEGVTARPHRFGGVEFRYGRRELGHLHGDAVADLPFHPTLRQMLVETGRVEPHRYVPDSGWVTYRIAGEAGIAEAIELFRLAYERARVAERVRAERGC